jgi:hypothetical protein
MKYLVVRVIIGVALLRLVKNEPASELSLCSLKKRAHRARASLCEQGRTNARAACRHIEYGTSYIRIGCVRTGALDDTAHSYSVNMTSTCSAMA